MRRALLELRSDPRGRHSLVLRVVSSEGLLLAWALLFPARHNQRLQGYFYVRTRCRHRGLGRALAAEMNRLRPRHRIQVRPHDPISASFFNGFPKMQQQGSPGYLRGFGGTLS